MDIFFNIGASSLFLIKIIAKLEITPRITPQNKDASHVQREQQQTMHKQQHTHRHRTEAAETLIGRGLNLFENAIHTEAQSDFALLYLKQQSYDSVEK